MSRRKNLFLLRNLFLVLYQFQPLPSVERELVVVADEGDTIAQRMGDNDMVARVIVLLRLVDFEAGILLIVLLVEVEDLELRVFLHRAYHVLRCLPPSSDVWFIVPQQHELPERLSTQVNLVVVVLKDGYHVTREILTFFEVPNEDVRVNF